jgi:MSHA biogenesis protein MshM
MYLGHFGLTALPFGITPDTQFIYSAAAHQEALNTLLLAVRGGEGFVKITGEVGTGKTLLCRRFLALLGEDCVAAYIPNPQVDATALLHEVAEELGLAAAPADDAVHVVKRINGRLLELAEQGKTAVLCIDEAQTMPAPTLETLRLISNLETEKRKLIQIVLFGQPELDANLALPAVRQLRQRIVFHYRMPGLPRRELRAYVEHRLLVAGYRGRLFSSLALRALYRHSAGMPRLVNILAHKALLAAFGEGEQIVGRRHVRAAARDTEGALKGGWLALGV